MQILLSELIILGKIKARAINNTFMFKEGEQFIPDAKLAQRPPAEEVKKKPSGAAKEPDQEKQPADITDDKSLTMEDKVEKFDPMKDRLLKFLEEEKILQKINGYTVFDQTKLNDTEFIRRSLGHLYLGRKEDGRQLMGSKKIIFEKLADLEIVPLEDYLAKKQQDEKITPLKLSVIITPPDLSNEERKAEVRAHMLEFLEKKDVLKVIGNLNVMDMAKLRGREFYNHLTNRDFLTSDKRSFSGGQMLLFETLADFEVISKEDFQETIKKRTNIITKPLFNVPESVDEAFDLEKLKNKEYYLNFWDLYSHDKHPGTPFWSYDMTARNGEKINTRELALATGIFRDHNGKRNEKGELVVFDKEKNDYVKVSAQWVVEHIGSFGTKGKNAKTVSFATPAPFLLTYGHNLLAKGLVKLEDFRQKSGDKSGNLMRKEFYPDSREFSANVDGVRYYLGREKYFIFNKEKIPTEYLKAVVLDNKTVGIVEIAGKKEILRFTLELLSDEEKKEKRASIEEKKPGLNVQQITALTVVGKKEIADRIKPWEAEEDNPPMIGETHQKYSKRMRHIDDFDFIKQISKDFQKEQIGIHNLTWREQQWLCGTAYHLGRDYPKLLEFGKKYGLEGLRTFLSCEYDLGNGEKILNIGDLPQDKAAKIFARYAEIVGSANNIENILADVLNDKPIDSADNKISREISQNLLKKGRDMLVDFAGKIEQGKKRKSAFSPEQILHELEEYRDNIILTATAYKSLAKDKDFNIEDLRGITTEKITAGQLNGDKKIVEKVEKMLVDRPEWPTIHGSALRGMVNEYAQLSDDKDMEAAEQIIEMAHIYHDNYAANPALQKKLVKGFLQALKTGGDDITVYTIKKDEEIMAFDRFDKVAEGKKYFSSFNVRPVIHGSAIGGALMKISLRPEARDNELEADCDPNKSISQKYIEDEGFVGRGINDYGGTAMTLNIYNKKGNNRYYYRRPGLNKAAVMADYEKTAQEAGQADRFVLKFKTGSSQLFSAIDKYVNQGGYALTRYFFAGTGNREVYCAFEKPSGDKGGN